MPSILHMGLVGTCSHTTGVLTAVTAAFKVRVKGMPVLTRSDVVTIGGCNVLPACVKVKWLTASSRILVSGQPVVLASSLGVGDNGTPIPGGPVVITFSQPLVQGKP